MLPRSRRALCLALALGSAASPIRAAWEKINPPNFVQVDILAVAADGSLTVCNNTIGALYTSLDAGKTWTVKGDALSGIASYLVGALKVVMIAKSSLVVHPSGDVFLLGNYLEGALKGGLFQTTDRGANFSLVGDPFSAPAPNFLHCTAAGDLILGYPAATQGAIATYKISQDKGRTWADAGTFAAVNAFASNPDGWLYAVGHQVSAGRQVLYRSRDAGKTWDSLWTPGSGLGSSTVVQGLAANRKDAVLLSMNNSGMVALVPGKDSALYGAYASAGGFAEALALTDDYRAVAGVGYRGVLFSDPDLEAFTASNAGLGADTASIRSLQYDKHDNLYVVAGQNLYVQRVASTALRRRAASPLSRSRYRGSGGSAGSAGSEKVDAGGRRLQGRPAAGARFRLD